MGSSICCDTILLHYTYQIGVQKEEHTFLPIVKMYTLGMISDIELCRKYIISQKNQFVNIFFKLFWINKTEFFWYRFLI